MQHPDEGIIHAWLDGALTADEAAAIDAHVSGCAACAAVAAEARGLIARSSRIISALDSVPAGVIPITAKRPRVWYARAQFRAAAAVLIVAAGTLLIVKSRPADVIQKNQAVATVAAREAVRDTLNRSVLRSESSAPASAPAAPKPTTAAPSKTKEAARSSGRASGANRQVASSDLMKKVSETEQAGDARLGAAMGNAPSAEESVALRQIRSDTTAGVVTTVYEVSPGVEVRLTEVSVPQFAPQAARKLATPRIAAAAAPPPPVALEEAKPVVDSITWTDSRGRLQKLIGPVSRDRLEAIRKLLTPDKR